MNDKAMGSSIFQGIAAFIVVATSTGALDEQVGRHTAHHGFVVDRYHALAEGMTDKNAQGKLMMSRVMLCRTVTSSEGKHPTPAELERLHHQEHDACFIANSVKTEVLCEPQPSVR